MMRAINAIKQWNALQEFIQKKEGEQGSTIGQKALKSSTS
jgi:hypothetical protein